MMLMGWIIFITVYAILAIGQSPFFKLDRTGMVFVGAVATVIFGILTLHEAFLAQEYKTILLLFNMMLIISFLVNSGIFLLITKVLNKVKSGIVFFWIVFIASGVLSALFINDVICLVLTPIVISVVVPRKWDPMPFLLGIAFASNIGSLCTPIGNPQNMYIASVSGISYKVFFLKLFPISVFSMLITGGILTWFYRKKLNDTPDLKSCKQSQPKIVQYVFIRTLIVLIFVLIAFWMGYEPAVVSGAAAALLLFTRRIPRKRLFSFVDWDLLVLFSGLFVVMAGTQKLGIIQQIYNWIAIFRTDNIWGFSFITTVLSNIFGNVPAVLFLGQKIFFGDPQLFWLNMAAVSTLAGNLTLIGSIANLIVAEKAKEHHITISFWTYTKIGLPITILLIILTILYLSIN